MPQTFTVICALSSAAELVTWFGGHKSDEDDDDAHAGGICECHLGNLQIKAVFTYSYVWWCDDSSDHQSNPVGDAIKA